MKVTLNEDQILQAIADYVGRRMPGATRDDMNIKLHATRGPEGYTSSVEVDPTYVNRNQRPAFIETGVLGGEPLGATELVGMTEEPAEAADVEEVSEPEADVAADDSVEQEPEAEAEPEAPAEEPAPEPEPAAEEETAKPAPKRSIFADMKKPVNSKAEAA